MTTVDIVVVVHSDSAGDTPPPERQLHHFIGDDLQINVILVDQNGAPIDLTVTGRTLVLGLRTGNKPTSPLVLSRGPSGYQDRAGGRAYLVVAAGDTAGAQPATWYWDLVYKDAGARQHVEIVSRFNLLSSLTLPTTPQSTPPAPGESLLTIGLLQPTGADVGKLVAVTGSDPPSFGYVDPPAGSESAITVQTTDDTPLDVVVIAPPAKGVYVYTVAVTAQLDDGSDGAAWKLEAFVLRDASGACTLLGGADIYADEHSTSAAGAWGIGVHVAGGEIVVTVIGGAAQTVDWTIKFVRE